MQEINDLLSGFADKTHHEMPIATIQKLLRLTKPDVRASERVWNAAAVAESVGKFAAIHHHSSGFVYVDRGRGLNESRRETRGILTGGEAEGVPSSRITLFLLRTKAEKGAIEAWWPQIRLPIGPYAFAFAI
jgi:hypothetical protein